MKCTWAGCMATAVVPQVNDGGETWANLCDLHHRRFEDAKTDGDVKAILSGWVKAQGGAKSAAKRMR